MVLKGSWVVISGAISLLIWFIIMVTLFITPLITTHEPPSAAFRASMAAGRPVVNSTRHGTKHPSTLNSVNP